MSDPTSRRIAPRTMAAVVMVAVFAAGAAAGVAFDHGVLHRRPQFTGTGYGPRPEFVPGAPMPRGGPGGRQPGRSPSLDRFVHDLGLTPAQTAVVDSAMAHDFAAVRAAREAMQPRVDSIVSATRAQIDSVLTAPQREKYHAMLAEQQKRAESVARERRQREGGGPM